MLECAEAGRISSDKKADNAVCNISEISGYFVTGQCIVCPGRSDCPKVNSRLMECLTTEMLTEAEKRQPGLGKVSVIDLLVS